MSDLMKKFFPNGAPKIIEVAFKHGYGEAIMDLNKKVYFNDELSFSPIILESIQALCLSSCENEYCAVMHTRGLITHGFSLDEVRHLIEHHRLPTWVEESQTWNPVLRKVSTLFTEPMLASALYVSMEEHLTPRQVADVGGVVAFSLLHKFLLEFYPDEIVIDDEPILFQTVDQGPELISYFRDRLGTMHPMYAICCLCKDVQTADSWTPIERALSKLPPGAVFSHGMCETCGARARRDLSRLR